MPRFKRPRKAKASLKAEQPDQLLTNLHAIKNKLNQYEDKPLSTIPIQIAVKNSVQQKQVTQAELKALEQEIDKLIENATKTLALPLPSQLHTMAETMAVSDQSNLVFEASKLKALIQNYGHQVEDYYLNKTVWQTPDTAYQSLVNHPEKYSPKVGGAKNTGKRTGVYTFTNENQTETMLIKQGADVGETVAEYIGANLYGLIIPKYSARCIMLKDNSSPTPSIDDVYVASIYQKANKIQDAYAAAGYGSRELFAGTKARLKKVFKSDDSLVRKVLELNDESGHTLEYGAANILWHGDNDFHTGNIVFSESDDEKKFVKIDHGFSFFNFNKKVIDIFNPTAGKVFSFSPRKFINGGKLIEFYPTNHFWDYAIENKQFYFNAHFIKACEEIANLTPEAIRNNIEDSLINIQRVYGKNANEALKQFGLRIGMKENQIELLAEGSTDLLRYKIEDHMVHQLIQRQASMRQLAEYCTKQTAKLDKSRHVFSKKLNKLITKNFDEISKIEEKSKNPNKSSTDHINHQNRLLKEIEALKLIQQANDLGILEITNKGEFTIKDEFHFHNAGQSQLVTPDAFKQEISKIVSNNEPFDISKQYPLSEKSLALLHDIRLHAKKTEETSKQKKNM